jgi:PAS domain-containing protein
LERRGGTNHSYKAEEIIGHHFSVFFVQEGWEEDRPEELLRLTAANGRYEGYGMRVRKDGSLFPADVIITTLLDANGGLRGFSEITRDISESKASEARYLGLLEAANDAMVVVDQEGKIVLLNVQAEKQFGYGRDELISRRIDEPVPEGFAESLIADALRSDEDAQRRDGHRD